MKTKFVPMLPAALNEAIGAFITTWSNAAGLFTMLISNLSAGRTVGPGDDMVFAFAHIGMDVRTQLGLIKTMGAARLGESHEKMLMKLCERLEDSKSMRDKMAHSPWEVGSGKPYAHVLKTVGKVKIEKHAFTAQMVNDETEKLVAALGELIALMQSNGFLANYELRQQV